MWLRSDIDMAKTVRREMFLYAHRSGHETMNSLFCIIHIFQKLLCSLIGDRMDKCTITVEDISVVHDMNISFCVVIVNSNIVSISLYFLVLVIVSKEYFLYDIIVWTLTNSEINNTKSFNGIVKDVWFSSRDVDR